MLLVLSPSVGIGQTAYNGYLDYAGCGSISGWALDWNRLTTSITVSIYDGSNLILPNILASNYRPDLLTGGGPSTQNHGFVVGTPSSLLDAQTHQINATYESSGISLFNSPQSLVCHAYNGYVDSVTLDTISGWALDWNNVENPITVDIYDGDTLVLAGVIANTYRPDLQTGGDYNSHVHGFSVATPAILLNGGQHTVVVAYGGSTSFLQNNFQTLGAATGPAITAASNLSSTWQYSPLYYGSRTAFSSQDVATVVNRWTSIQNSFGIPYGLNPGFLPDGHYDITISDENTLGAGVYGRTDYTTAQSPDGLNHPNGCGVCYTSGVRVEADINLNHDEIIHLATSLGFSSDTAAQVFLSHELGHALNLTEPVAGAATACSQVQTIMYPNAATQLSCATIAGSPTYGGLATTQDGAVVQNYYGKNPKNKTCPGNGNLLGLLNKSCGN